MLNPRSEGGCSLHAAASGTMRSSTSSPCRSRNAISGERTLEAFYEAVRPFAQPFMVLFGRERLPPRSALSRFLAALTQAPVEALHTLATQESEAGLWDRQGRQWSVFDIYGTREAARQRALPQNDDLPPAFRRLDDVCATGYRGRKRGQVVRTRTVVSQAHALLRLDGQYGTGAALADVAGFASVTRGKEYTVLDHPLLQARLHLPADQFQQRPESQTVRSLYDCLAIPAGPEGVTRAGMVYELFFTNLPQQAFTASDVVELYLHRGAFEPTLSDEDEELDPDRWCSHSAQGQEAWQVISQWVWNLGLEPGHHLKPEPLRTHYRLSWQQRLARNARLSQAAPPTITLHGVPDHFAAFLGLRTA